MEATSILYPAGWHWTKTELTYHIDPAVAAWTPTVYTAMDGWDRASGLTLTQVGSPDAADIQITTLAALDAPENAKGWSVFWADEGAVPAIVRGFVGLPLSPDVHGGAESIWIALHEVGHVLGLSHPHQTTLGTHGDHTDTIMSYNPAADGVYPVAPAPLDVAAIQRLYGHDRVLLGDGGDGPQTLRGGEGSDLLNGGAGADALYGHRDPDWLAGGAGGDWLHGGQGDDTVEGGDGNDLVMGGDGADRLRGDGGDDTLDGGPGADTFVFAANGGHDTVVGFDPAAGDRLELFPGAAAPETAWSTAGDGSLVLSLGSGTTVTLAGVGADALDAGWLVV